MFFAFWGLEASPASSKFAFSLRFCGGCWIDGPRYEKVGGVFAGKNKCFLRFGAWKRALQAQKLYFHCGFVGVMGFPVLGVEIQWAFSMFSWGNISVFCILGLGSEPCKLKICIFTAFLYERALQSSARFHK